MSSFIFNEFKKRYLNGEVKNEGAKWTFTPVKKDFIDKLNGENIKPEQFKTKKSIESFLEDKGGYNKMVSDLYQVEYAYSKLVVTASEEQSPSNNTNIGLFVNNSLKNFFIKSLLLI